MIRAADGNVQLVCRYDAEFWISKLPPELMTDYGYIQCRARLDSILDRKNYAGCREKQDNDYQDRDHCPSELNLVTAINLGRLRVVRASRSVPHNHENEQCCNYDKHCARDAEDKSCHMVDLDRWGRFRREDICSGVGNGFRRTQFPREKGNER